MDRKIRAEPNLRDGMRHFPLRSTRSERLFAFLHLYYHFFFWRQFFSDGWSLDLANTVGNRLFSLSACWFVRNTHWWLFTRKGLYYLFDITVRLSSVPLKTTLCRMLGLTGLVALLKLILQVKLIGSGNADSTRNNWRIVVRSYERACDPQICVWVNRVSS